MSESRELPKCFDCKWPEQSKVAQACQCRGNSVERHQSALAEARALQDNGVPLSDPRYYEDITEQQRARLVDLAKQLRRKAEPVGPLHGAWDTIFDIEQFLQGQRTLLIKSAEEWIAFAEADLRPRK